METKVMQAQLDQNSRWLNTTKNPLFGLLIAFICVIPYGVFSGFSTLALVGILLVTWLAVENGGNDVSKGVAPLVSAGAVGEWGALIYGTVATAVGSLLSIYFSMKLLKLFTAGLIAPSFTVSGITVLAMAAGASLWVALATRYSWPVSTTHAIVGSVVAVGALAFGTSGVLWGSLVSKVVIPLLFSPLVGVAVGLLLSFIVQMIRLPNSAGTALTWLSSGTVCFVRAVNDTPKIVAIGVLTAYSSLDKATEGELFGLFALITVAMCAGSLLKGMNILKLLSGKLTKSDNISSLSAVVSTATLVLSASQFGLPVSTTHVSTSSIVGASMRQGVSAVNWHVVREMVLSWIVTLPAAGAFAATVYFIAKLF